jgi:hypothetical protein
MASPSPQSSFVSSILIHSVFYGNRALGLSRGISDLGRGATKDNRTPSLVFTNLDYNPVSHNSAGAVMSSSKEEECGFTQSVLSRSATSPNVTTPPPILKQPETHFRPLTPNLPTPPFPIKKWPIELHNSIEENTDSTLETLDTEGSSDRHSTHQTISPDRFLPTVTPSDELQTKIRRSMDDSSEKVCTSSFETPNRTQNVKKHEANLKSQVLISPRTATVSPRAAIVSPRGRAASPRRCVSSPREEFVSPRATNIMSRPFPDSTQQAASNRTSQGIENTSITPQGSKNESLKDQSSGSVNAPRCVTPSENLADANTEDPERKVRDTNVNTSLTSHSSLSSVAAQEGESGIEFVLQISLCRDFSGINFAKSYEDVVWRNYLKNGNQQKGWEVENEFKREKYDWDIHLLVDEQRYDRTYSRIFARQPHFMYLFYDGDQLPIFVASFREIGTRSGEKGK